MWMNTRKVYNMEAMFNGTESLKYIYVGPSWDNRKC